MAAAVNAIAKHLNNTCATNKPLRRGGSLIPAVPEFLAYASSNDSIEGPWGGEKQRKQISEGERGGRWESWDWIMLRFSTYKKERK